jgi:prepilin-type N-terminal cleavage/methylation domain-containing protein
MHLRLLSLRERGDTIVEVLIAIAIISLILATAYTITSKNTLDLQNNAERVQGQHLVESQLEALKANDGIIGGTCFNSAAVPASGPACNQTTTGSGATYTLHITSAGNLYTVDAQWTSLGAHRPSEITMYYRLKN